MNVKKIDIARDPRISGATVSLVSLAKSQVSLAFHAGLKSDFSYLELVDIYEGEVFLFRGLALSPNFTEAGLNTRVSLDIVDFWHLLEDKQMLRELDPTKGAVVVDWAKYERDQRLGAGTLTVGTAGKTGIKEALVPVLDEAKKVLSSYNFDFEISGFDDMVIPPFATQTKTFAQIIKDVLRWAPDAVSYWELRGEKNTLVIAHRQGKEIALSTPQSKIKEVAGMWRHDLIPPVVGIIGKATTPDGRSAYAASVYPEEVSLDLPGAMVIQVDAEATGRLTDPEVRESRDPETGERYYPVSGTLSPEAQYAFLKGEPVRCGESAAQGQLLKYWSRLVPELKALGQKLQFGEGRVTPQDYKADSGDADAEIPKNYSKSATKYEFLEGAINEDFRHVKWCDVLLEQCVLFKGIPEEKYRALFPFFYEGKAGFGFSNVFKMEVRTISRRRAKFLLDAGGTPILTSPADKPEEEEEEDEPYEEEPITDPMAVGRGGKIDALWPHYYDEMAKTAFLNFQTLHFEGSVVGFGRDFDAVRRVGDWLLLTTPSGVFAGKKLLIQSISYSSDTRETLIKVGVPSHLSLQDMIERVQALNAQQKITADLNAKEEAEAPANGGFWGDGNSSLPSKIKERVQAPGITPRLVNVTPSLTPDSTHDFAVRFKRDMWGNAMGAQMRQGRIFAPQSGLVLVVPEGETWQDIPKDGKIYIALSTDKCGKIDKSSARITTEPTPVIPFAQSPHTAAEHTSSAGSYCWLIATLEGDKITQHQQGAITLTYTEGGTPIVPHF